MGHSKLKIFLAGSLILLGNAISDCMAQEVPGIEKLTEVNGSFEKINEIQQDSIGNLWIASDDHVQRYNSFFSEFYSQFKGMPEKAGKINTLFIDSQNRIWTGTENGLYRYNPEKNVFVAIPSERANTKTNVQQIAEDEFGKIWIGSNSGIWNYTRNQLVLISPFPSKQSVNDLAPVDQRIVFGTSKGLFSLNKNSGQYKKIPLLSYKDFNVRSILFTGEAYLIGTQENGLYKTDKNFSNPEKIYSLPFSAQKTPIEDISIDKAGNVYLASKGDGLLILNKNLKLASHYLQQENNNLSLSDNSLNGLFLDKYNTLWVSTESGQINSINLKQNNFEFLRHDPKKYSSLADNFTTAIEEDKNGNVWFGTRQGLSVWNRRSDSWQHLKNLSFKYQSNIPDIIRDLQADDMHMWVATFNDGVYKININTFLRAQYSTDALNKTGLQKVNALLVDTNKNVWAGGEDGNLTRIDPNNEIKSFTLRGISAMAQLDNGDVLAAGKNGVFNIHTGANTFQPIKKLDPNTKNLPYFNINTISETLSGEIVLATEGAGIVVYNPEAGSVKVINVKSGLPSNRIQGLLIYGRNEVWAGTNKGLVNFVIEDNPTIRVFDKDDGLLSAVFTRGSFAQLDNKLAFGTLKGVSVFNPNKLKSKPETVPNILFGALDVMSKEDGTKSLANFDSGKKLKLGPDQNSFHIKFYGMTPGDYSQLAYSWKLEGLDTEWSDPSTQNEANYANLAPGKYTFLVKAKKANGQWSAVKQVSMNIASPWWASTGAYVIFGILLLALIGIPLYLFRIHKKRESKAARSKFYSNLNQEIGTPLTILLTSLENIAEEESKTKHRLKNTVNRLKELLEPILNFQPSKFRKANAAPVISRIALDNYFEELIKDFNPLLRQKNLEIIVNNQWNQEFFYYDADNLNKIFFNLISSAIKYSFDEGKIIINLIGTNKGDLKIQVADNGLGLPREDQKVIKEYYRSSRSGIAAENSEHINLLYVKDFIDKLGGTIVFESSKDQGTTFTLILKNHIKDEIAQAPKTEEIQQVLVEKPILKNEPELTVIRDTKPIKVEEKVEIEESVPQEIVSKNESTTEEIRILIVEDNDELRKVFVQSFKKLGEVFDAKNGLEAYEIASRIIPNAILTDFDMPGMDGITLYNAIKENPDLHNVPVFVMVTDENRMQLPVEDQSELLQLIAKPVNLELLLLKVEGKMKASAIQPYVNTNLSERNSNLLKGGLDDKFIANLEAIIVQNIHDSSFTVEDLSEAIGMSSNSLYLKLKNLNGLTPLDFITRTKLIYARSLLNKGESDLSEVARQAGFQNKDIFFSSFKKYFGFMPGTIMEKNKPTK
ncbi:signal transduction histidine kinase [Gillisia sp. Hel_I_86]|uniref:hybrid sensor histidine kinase/response regulator transcription factor n=1 Tax=Gillisia sp. Hel_I_86 TaxID=1249981 RepID=UPI00119984B0|nr:two-component regulator propeller domain-containing protein [Gillisia sp. Hel_I_86]TVZ25517.1 signal transduction histidine kinase [Gillisia sp. Hel_I_86]